MNDPLESLTQLENPERLSVCVAVLVLQVLTNFLKYCTPIQNTIKKKIKRINWKELPLTV